MEKCECDLESVFNGKIQKFNKNPLSHFEILSIYLNIVIGMECLHNLDFIHTDLNLRNIFLIENSRFNIKIGDLGLCI